MAKRTYVYDKKAGKVTEKKRKKPAKKKAAGGHSSAAWPKVDDLCTIKDRKRFEKKLKAKGVTGVETFIEQGRVKIRMHDRNERKRLYEALDRFDIDAGMSGDPKPNEKHYRLAEEQRRIREAEERRQAADDEFIREFESQGSDYDESLEEREPVNIESFLEAAGVDPV